MTELHPVLRKSYWTLAGLGIAWAAFLLSMVNPWVQRQVLYSHKLHTAGWWHNVTNPEEFGFAKGQVQPWWLDTPDGERLFCWHVLPLDTYLENEMEIVQKYKGASDGLEGTVGAKLLQRDLKSKVVINFHGNAGHLAQGYRPATFRSIAGIPHTHLLTCDYRGFGLSTLKNAPHVPTEPGVITDAIALTSYLLSDLQHPASRTVLLGQSLGTAVTAATSLYFADPQSSELPPTVIEPTSKVKTPVSFASIVLVAPFTDIPQLLKTYHISGWIPILSPLSGYPRIAKFLTNRIVDHWPTLPRLKALVAATSATKSPLRISILHARNDGDISFRHSEQLYNPLEMALLGEEGATSSEERRSIHGGERVNRGAFAYRKVEDAGGERSVELEIVRYGGHNEVVGFAQVGLAVRRAFKVKTFKPGLDVE